MLSNTLGKGFRNADFFTDFTSQKRYQFTDERGTKNILKATSVRTKDALTYDFTSSALNTVSKTFFDLDEMKLSKSLFSSVLKENIQSERAKGTAAIILKIKPRESDVIDVADAEEVAAHCGFKRVSASRDCIEYLLCLSQDPNRE